MVLVARPPSRKFCWEFADDESGYAPGGAASSGHNAAEIPFVCDEWRVVLKSDLEAKIVTVFYFHTLTIPSMSCASMYMSVKDLQLNCPCFHVFPGQLAVVGQRQFHACDSDSPSLRLRFAVDEKFWRRFGASFETRPDSNGWRPQKNDAMLWSWDESRHCWGDLFEGKWEWGFLNSNDDHHHC